MEPLTFAREVWKAFELNNSPNAGMKLTEKVTVTKQHGTVHDYDESKLVKPVILTKVKK